MKREMRASHFIWDHHNYHYPVSNLHMQPLTDHMLAGFVCKVDAAQQLDAGQQAANRQAANRQAGRQAGRLAADEGQIKGDMRHQSKGVNVRLSPARSI